MLQSQGTLGRELFQAYDCEEEGERFGINLTMLLDCLQVLRPSKKRVLLLSKCQHVTEIGLHALYLGMYAAVRI